MDENRIYIEKIKTLMLDRLGTCGIIALEENEIKSEHVKTFREGLAKYLEAIENLKGSMKAGGCCQIPAISL